jgi:hypothetical protein
MCTATSATSSIWAIRMDEKWLASRRAKRHVVMYKTTFCKTNLDMM